MIRAFTVLVSFLLLIIIDLTPLIGQKNIEFQSNLFFEGGLNDIWGYVDDEGREYALIGKQLGFAIVDITDPLLPELLYEVPGEQSTWRDVKTWGHYAYMVDDQAGEGMLIVDLSQAPDAFSHVWWTDWPTCGNSPQAHNIFIDENGFAYLSGMNCTASADKGLYILDLNENPMSPTLAGIYDHNFNDFGFGNYVHDVFVRGDTAWMAQINDGLLVVADVSDKANIQVLGSAPTSSNKTHNLWLSEDGKHLYTTDEVSGGYIDSYNVEDLSDIKRLDIVQSSPGENVAPHNTFFIDDYLVTAYYTDGVTIHDVSNPSHMVEVGNYDTSPDFSGSGFNGCWGVCPYLPSGNIIAADIQEGLYVLTPNYVRSAQLEVTVLNQDGFPVSDVEVAVESLGILTSTNLFGVAFTGTCEEGTYSVSINEGEQLISDVNFISGELNELTVEVQTGNLNLIIKDWEGNPIEGAAAFFKNDFRTYSVVSNLSGQIVLNNALIGDYEVYVGAWGYENVSVGSFDAVGTYQEKEVWLAPKYQDDFIVDMGWEISGNASAGHWTRTEPTGTLLFDGEDEGGFPPKTEYSPELDIQSDVGDHCFVTGDGTTIISANDVDGGEVILTSLPIDVSSYEDPYLSYHYWFADLLLDGNNVASLGDDTLTMSLLTDTGSVLLDRITSDPIEGMGEWFFNNHRLKDFISTENSFRVEFKTADDVNFLSSHWVEAAIDVFSIVDSVETFVGFAPLVTDGNGNGILGEIIVSKNGIEIQTGNTNVFGGVSFSDLEPGVYTITIGAWGYIGQTFENVVITEDSQEIEFVLSKGYQDDFSVDLGWVTTSEQADESSGIWEIGEPEGTSFDGSVYNPNSDVKGDLGVQCYTTGLAKGEEDENGDYANSNDVDGGPLSLISPTFDLSNYEEPWLSYHYWFANGGGETPIDDVLSVSLSNGLETVEVVSVDGSIPTAWTKALIRVSDYLEQTSEMNLIFTVTDQGDDHITEAAIDYFEVIDSVIIQPGFQNINLLNASIAPNPVEANTVLELSDFDSLQSYDLRLMNLKGQLVFEQKIIEKQTTLQIEGLGSGLYILSVKRDGELLYAEKLLKQ